MLIIETKVYFDSITDNKTKPELRFCACSNPAHGVSEIRDVEDF